RHRFESLTLYEDRRDDNGAPLGIDPAAQPSVERRHLFTSLRWVGHISEAITVRNQLGFQSLRDEEMPLRCRREGDTCDALASMTQRFPINFLSNNWPRHQIEGQTEWQFVDGVEARLYQNDWIRERLVSSSRVSFLEARWRYHTPGDRELFFNGAERESERVTFATDPRQGPVSFGWSSWRGSALTALHSLESETRLRERLWIVPGVGITVDRVRSDLFTVASSTVTPHLDLAWDVWGDGRTWLRAASHQRATADAAALLSFSRGAPVTRQCQWDPDAAAFTKSCVFSGGFTGTVGLPCGPDGVGADGAPCRTGLRAPRAWEHSLGAEQALGRGFRLAVDGVYRRPANLAETVETNRIWNSTGNTGNGFRNGRAQTVFDYANSDPGQRYLDLTVAVKKPDGAFQMLAAYTYSHYRGIAESPGPWGGAVGARGYYLDDVRPHSLRMLGSYDIAGYASVAAIYRHDSGRPLRWYRAVPQASFENTRGVNPGTTVNDPGDDGPTRLPDEDRLNLQVRLRGQRLVGVDVDLYADVINALEERRAFVPETSFAPAAVREGRWFRLGLEYRH
ncbi:MAG TPA: hypothetical protein VN914_01255, partial [Polyangia bacterium]|nr:hypothetical protein [Polyangia bacterium]